MQRRKPSSARQKKEQLKQKRAVKRGDISPPPPPSKEDRRRRAKRGPAASTSALSSQRAVAAADSSRRLQSSFVKLPHSFLDHTKWLASTIPLQRPISSEVLVSHSSIFSQDAENVNSYNTVCTRLTCPKRPKWRYDMSKNEVEKNEEGLFKKWLEATDEVVNDWFRNDLESPSTSGTPSTEEPQENPPLTMPSAPTSFERNIEVWRQLWRVTEIAQVLLILLDSRCPLLHYPPSLAAYLSSPHIANHTRTILVLTKVDISGPVRAAAWVQFLNQKLPHLRVVQVESYVEKSHGDGTTSGRKHFEPHLPSAFRHSLVEALKETHAELLEPPERLKDKPERLKAWKPPVKREVNWQEVLNAHGGKVGTITGGPTAPLPREDDLDDERGQVGDEDEDSRQAEPDFLTVGLIGQPNVGKSSLLNALFGTSKVKASKTPGKTKHFQTLFWTPEVRLVDCPGLVMPNLTPMETQVLSGILPISQVSAAPLCTHHVAQLLPLEKIYGLQHPSLSSPPEEDKRTWREPRPNLSIEKEVISWTALDILTAHALRKGWVTAKAGRPDINRSGNSILRAVAEGKIPWAFWPPGTPPSVIDEHQNPGDGIWISRSTSTEEKNLDTDSEDGDTAAGEDSDSDVDNHFSNPKDSEHSEEEEGNSGTKNIAYTTGRFGALVLDDP